MSPRKPARPGKDKPGSTQDEGGSGFLFRDRSGKVHTPKTPNPTESARASEAETNPGLGLRAKALTPRGKPRGKRSDVPMPDSEELRRKAKSPSVIIINPASANPPAGKSSTKKGPWREERPARRSEGRSEGQFKGRDEGKNRGWGEGRGEGRKEYGGSDRKYARKGDRDSGRGSGHDRKRDDRGPKRRESKPRPSFSGYQKFKGTIDKNRKGFAFLILADRKQEDLFIPPREAEAYFHGDRVEATMNSRGQIASIEVLEHRFRELVGRYFPEKNAHSNAGWVVYERKRAREEVYIPNGSKEAKKGQWVRASLVFPAEDHEPVTGEILEIYGDDLPPSADVGMIAAEYNLIENHTKEAEDEAKSFTLDLDLTHRQDLRSTPFITIDGERARDFDDAVYVEAVGGGFVLWVAIADVSHYVVPGTALDEDARSRATSVYFPERAFHMLPGALSENLCSLRPNETRLAMVARMELDSEGTITGTKLIEALIESKRRATYEEIEEEWQANKTNRDWEYAPHFDLYQLLRKKRSKRGSVDFDLPESEVLVKPTGEVEDIRLRGRLDTHRLIEEFMIAANESVTEWALERSWPFIYRVHDEPAEDAIEKFQKLAFNMGVVLDLDPEAGDLPQRLNSLIMRLSGHPAQTLLNMALLRSMKQAVYTSVHGIHFGLASRAYTHFTSPIRRYPDLIVHRMLRMALRTEQGKRPALKEAERDALEEALKDSAEHCSYRERLASDAERDSIKLKQVRVMIPHLGEEFEGKVMGMIESGMFVAINHPYVEGMVSQDSITEDHFQFNEDRMTFQGYRTRKTFRIGDKVRIRVARADVEARQLDFELLEGPLGTPVSYGGSAETSAPRMRGKERTGRKPRGREKKKKH